MKLYRNALILVVVLGLLAGAYFYLSNKKSKEAEPETAGDTIKLWELDKEKISQVTVENTEGKVVIENKDKKWVLTAPSNFKYDQSAVDGVVSNAAAVTADKLVEENASELGQYGLDKPVTVAVKLQDGSEKALNIGNVTPTKSGYYVKTKDDNKVYVLGTYPGDSLKASKADLINKKIFADNPDEVTAMGMEKAGQTVFAAVKKDSTEWSLTAPIQGNADASKLSQMIQSAIGANFSTLVEEKAADLDKYGLKNPSYSVELEAKGVKTRLLIGDEKEKGVEAYAKFANSDEVFTMGLSALNFLDKPFKEIMDVFVYIVNIDDVSKISVEMDGRTDNFDVQTDKENKDNDKFFVNGKNVSGVELEGGKVGDGLFRVYYQKLIGITLSEVEIGAKPQGKPELTITYTLKKAPGTMKVEFIPKDDRYAYALKNGEYTNIIVERKLIEELRPALKELEAAAAKAQ